MPSQIMLQGFKDDATHNGRNGEWWAYLSSKVPDIAASKIGLLWLPPPYKCRAQDWMGYSWMDAYDLGEYRQWVQNWDDTTKRLVWSQHSASSSLDDGNPAQPHVGTETFWGHRSELDALIAACGAADIDCVADIVLNQRDAQQVNAFDEFVCWKGDTYEIASKKMEWGICGVIDHPPEICGPYGVGVDDGEGGFSLNIAHTCANARADIKAWLAWMTGTVGFRGLRYDDVKGYAPQHVAEYNYSVGNPFSVGECWDGNAQTIYDWIDATDAYDVSKKSKAFDFPLYNLLRQVFWGTRPFSDLGLWKYALTSIAGGWPAKAVTFLENHDTYNTPYEDFPHDAKRVVQGYVFLLTGAGTPCVFWSHFHEFGTAVHDQIQWLCQFRDSRNIAFDANVTVLRAAESCYAANVNGRIIVKIGDEFWSPYGIEGNWLLVRSGEGWAIWEQQ